MHTAHFFLLGSLYPIALGQHSKQIDRNLMKARDKREILHKTIILTCSVHTWPTAPLGHFYEGVDRKRSLRSSVAKDKSIMNASLFNIHALIYGICFISTAAAAAAFISSWAFWKTNLCLLCTRIQRTLHISYAI